jgi:hypothetical protein
MWAGVHHASDTKVILPWDKGIFILPPRICIEIIINILIHLQNKTQEYHWGTSFTSYLR